MIRSSEISISPDKCEKLLYTKNSSDHARHQRLKTKSKFSKDTFCIEKLISNNIIPMRFVQVCKQ